MSRRLSWKKIGRQRQKKTQENTTVENQIKTLGYVHKFAKCVAYELSEWNRMDRVEICPAKSFFDRLIADDEKWIMYNNVVRKPTYLIKRHWLYRIPIFI